MNETFESRVARVNKFHQLNDDAKSILRRLLDERNQNNVGMSDIGFLDRNEQGYCAHYFDKDGKNCTMITVTFAYEQKPITDDGSVWDLIWDKENPIITIR